MTDKTDIVERLRHPKWISRPNDDLMFDVPGAVLDMASAADEIERLRQDVIAFGASWAGMWARSYGLEDGHLHPRHFDILERAGARMDDFTRAALGKAGE